MLSWRFRLRCCLFYFSWWLDSRDNSRSRYFKYSHWLRRRSKRAFCERWTHKVMLPRSGRMRMKVMIGLWIMEWWEKGLRLSMKGAIVQSWRFVHCCSINGWRLVTDSYSWNLLLVNIWRARMIRDLNIALRWLNLTWLLLFFCHRTRRYMCWIVIIQGRSIMLL
jgi:hypothetical protein